jgi:type IV pilus assembly protein PilX
MAALRAFKTALSVHRGRGPRQRGAVLIFGLIVLLVVTMIGISGQQGAVLQEKLVGNMRQNSLALQAAEAALQAGLSYVAEQAYPIVGTDAGTYHVYTGCTVARALSNAGAGDQSCGRAATVIQGWKTDSPGSVQDGVSYKTIANLTSSGFGGDIPAVIEQPRVYIEVRVDPESPDTQANSFGRLTTYYYTVTSLGFGGNAEARAVLQSTIARQVHQ